MSHGRNGKTQQIYIVPKSERHLMSPSKSEQATSLTQKVTELEEKQNMYLAAGDLQKAHKCRQTICALNGLIQKMR